jgi:hypothetical protein
MATEKIKSRESKTNEEKAIEEEIADLEEEIDM